MSHKGLAGDDYNDATEATRGAAAAHAAPMDFLGMAGMGSGPYDQVNEKKYGMYDSSPSKLDMPLMSFGAMSTQSQTPTMKPVPAGNVNVLQRPDAFALPVQQRDGSVWHAKTTPDDVATRDRFFFAPTSMSFDAEHLALHELVSRIYEFTEREFAVEIRPLRNDGSGGTNPSEGVFELACFVKTAMVIVRVQLWLDVEKGCMDKADTKHFNGLRSDECLKRHVVEMNLLEGCGITFCDIYRRFKKVLDPKNLLSERDALSTAASLSSEAGRDAHALVSEEVAMDGEQLMEFGGEFAFPTADEWESVLADCEVFHDDVQQNDAKCIAAAVESLASIACTYNAKDLEYLAKAVGDRKIGFCHECYCDGASAFGGACEGKNVLCQLWAMAVLVKHLSKHSGNLAHLTALVPQLDSALRKLLAESYGANCSGVCTWVTVVHSLAESMALVLAGCRNYGVSLNDGVKSAFPSSDANVDALYKQASHDGESRVAAAADHLKSAYESWTALRV